MYKQWSRTEPAGRIDSLEKFSIISAFEGASGSGILSNGVTGSIEKLDWLSVNDDGPFWGKPKYFAANASADVSLSSWKKHSNQDTVTTKQDKPINLVTKEGKTGSDTDTWWVVSAIIVSRISILPKKLDTIVQRRPDFR